MKTTSKFWKLITLAFVMALLTALMITAVHAEAGGSFANDAYPDATWTWTLDSEGTLTIGGTGSNGYTNFYYGGNWDATGEARIPWKKTGKIDGIAIKKVIILESTGITNLGDYSLAYLKYMEYLQIPSTLVSMNNALSTSTKLKSVYIAGNEPKDNYIDFSNIKKLGSYVSEGGSTGLDLTVELNKELAISGIKTYADIRWFKSANSLNFKLYRGSAAHNTLQLLFDNQSNSETLDTAYPDTVTFEFMAPYSGSFANDYHTNATWEWSLEDDGTLYIGGSAADGSTDFYYGASWNNVEIGSTVKESKKYIPWFSVKQTGKTASISDLVKKVVIAEETGITTLGVYSLGYLPNMTELVIPSTVTVINTSCLSTSSSLKTISVHGRTDAGEGIYDFRNIKTIKQHALAGAASASKVTEPITIWFSETMTGFPSMAEWNWFYGYGADNTTTTPNAAMTTKVIFTVYAGTAADSILSAYVAKQQTYDPSAETPDISQIDKTCTTNVEMAYYGIGGNCKDDFTGYRWDFDEDTGVLTISGTSTSTTLGFTTAADWQSEAQKNIAWYDYRSQIKKVIIKEETGITAIQKYVFSGLKNCTAIVMPTTISDLSAFNIFSDCTVLSSIAYSEDAIEENVYDLRYAKKINTQLFENTAMGMNITVKVSSGDLSEIKRWFYDTTTVNFEVFEGSPIDEWLKANAAGTETRDSKYRFTIGDISYMSINDNPLLTLEGIDTVNGNYSWVLDAETGTLTFTRLKTDWCEFYFSKSVSDFVLWLNDWRDDIKHIVVPEFSKYQDSDKSFPFSNLPNLETVKWDTTRMMSTGAGGDNVGMFYGCEKLTTFGTSNTFEKGVINLSGFLLESISTSNYSKNMFYGCKSIKKVVFGDSVYMTGDKAETIVPFVIGISMFEGCSSLESVEFEVIDGMMSNAFKDCTALKGQISYYGSTDITTAFDGCGGIIIITDSTKKATEIAASMRDAGITANEAFVAGMSHGGFSVRVSGYNGLRSFYKFAGESALALQGLTLVEYGSLCAASDIYKKYTQDLGSSTSILYLDGTEFKTSETQIIKTALYIAEGYTGEIADKKTVNEDGSVDFTVTVTNFKEKNYKSGVVMAGYEIWLDDNGNYTVAFTEVKNEDYKVTSLYKTTLGMILADVIEIGAENGPVYNMLNNVTQTAIETNNDAINAFIIDHHLLDGKKIAIYRTDSDTKIELESLYLPLDQIEYIVDFIFDTNVVCNIPTIDGYWKDHIISQLSTLPDGRSFIAITDTHYPGNAGKSADLMQYIRTLTGIKKVVNLGDPYHDGATYEIAKNNLILSMDTKFFSYFGDDGMYAIGNHDSNITMARKTGDSDNNTYKMDLLLSDKDIYDNSFKYVEEGGKRNDNVIYDEALLKIIEENKSEIKGFVLDNVAAEDAGSHNNMFGDVNYTAEQMYENLVYWAKMHYAYYDHESEICYIVLNTGGLTVTDFATLNRELWAFHPSQYLFLETILNQIAESYSNYDIVVAGHMFYDKSEFETNYNQDLFKMLSAFEGGSSVSFTAKGNNSFSGKLFGCENDAVSRSFTFDFSGNDKFTGEIICITGHRHIDLEIVSQVNENGVLDMMNVDYNSVADSLGDNAILCLLLNQDNVNENNNSVEVNTQKPVRNTITEHSFNIFTITDDNTLVVTRIGANSGWLQKTYNLG